MIGLALIMVGHTIVWLPAIDIEMFERLPGVGLNNLGIVCGSIQVVGALIASTGLLFWYGVFL